MRPDCLNTGLLSALHRKFGSDKVDIIHPRESIAWTKHRLPEPGADGKSRYTRKVQWSGEEYRLCCPFCNDTKKRLYINHRWGVQDPVTKSRNLWLAQCFNETRCLDDYDNQKELFEMVYLAFGGIRRAVVAKGKPPNPNRLVESPPPGAIMSFTEIQKLFKAHESIQYLVSRDFDPDYLEKHYQVGYCWDSIYPQARNRIYIPVHRKGMLVGWQCRFPGDDIDGKSLSECGLAKYWTMPRMAKSLAPYNYERAVTHSTVVIVEGPMDVWSTGFMSFGLLGVTMSPEMRKDFVADMHKNHGEDCTVVIMLDPEMPKKNPNSTKSIEHPIERLRKELKPHFKNILPVYLPKGFDPGSVHPEALHNVIRIFAEEKGIDVNLEQTSAKQCQVYA